MAKISSLGYNEQRLRLCIDGEGGGRVWGRVVSMRLSGPVFFKDLSEFVVKLDIVMDEQNFPQSFQRKRGFKSSAGRNDEAIRHAIEGVRWTKEQVDAESGSRATIDLCVTTRQNATWQGHVILPGQNGQVVFESDLALVQIIDDYLKTGVQEVLPL